MSVNIAIEEGGVARQFTAAEIETNKVGGGSQDWVPKNEVKLTTKHISKNGTYPASADGYYGFKSVTVNVAGGDGSADSSGKPNTGSPSVPGSGIAPGGPGSAVVGTDPETGNEEVVGVDESGNIVRTKIPSAIEITKPPDDTEYNEGDTIIYDGMVVGLKKKDGTTFTDSRYTNGHIPMGELIFPTEVAPAGGGSHGGESSGDYLVFSSNGYELGFDKGLFPDIQGAFYVYAYTSSMLFAEFICYSAYGTPSAAFIRKNGAGVRAETNPQIVGDWYTQNFGMGQIDVAPGWPVVAIYRQNDPTIQTIMGVDLKEVAPGDSGKAQIPVQWKSPYDGKTMEDKFNITVADTAHTTESSSGTEGSGGGGTF